MKKETSQCALPCWPQACCGKSGLRGCLYNGNGIVSNVRKLSPIGRTGCSYPKLLTGGCVVNKRPRNASPLGAAVALLEQDLAVV